MLTDAKLIAYFCILTYRHVLENNYESYIIKMSQELCA